VNGNIIKNNIKEFIGSFGDIGTFIPLAISLILINGINPTSLFVVAGMTYVLCGLYFKIPMPVQPMKMIAVAAIATGAEPERLTVAGIIIGILFIVFYTTKIIEIVNKFFNPVIVKGIQFGLGIMLIINGIKLLFKYNNYPSNILFDFGPVIPNYNFPSINDFLFAFIVFVLPQLPVTIGNSIVATVDASKVYFKGNSVRVTPSTLSFSLGLANIVSGILGGIPLCHGSGGLTAHYCFGARTGKAGIIIGTVFVLLGIFFGKSIINIVSFIPFSVLGVFIIYVGIRHALLIKCLFNQKQNLILSTLIGVLCVIINLPAAISIVLISNLIFKFAVK